MTRGRVLDIKSLLYRPFLYYAIHHRNSNPETTRIVEPWAQKALSTIIELTSSGPKYHRHHGIWATCRVLTSCALLILAAKKSGLISGGDAPQGSQLGWEYTHSFQNCLETLRYWESESPDIARAREVVESLRDDILVHSA